MTKARLTFEEVVAGELAKDPTLPIVMKQAIVEQARRYRIVRVRRRSGDSDLGGDLNESRT